MGYIDGKCYQPVSPSKQRSAFSTFEPNYGTIMSSLSKAEIPVVQKFPPLLKLSASRSKQSRPRRLQIETAPARFLLAPFQDIQLTFSKKVHHPLSPHLVLENNWIPKDKTAKQNRQKDSTIPDECRIECRPLVMGQNRNKLRYSDGLVARDLI